MFGCQAPDSGNAEILAHYGTEEQKAKYLQPLLDGEIVVLLLDDRAPGAAPTRRSSSAAPTKDGGEWVIDGEKWFSSNLRYAEFAIVMAVTDPDVSVYQGTSMFLVPTSTPGVDIIRNVGLGAEPRARARTPTSTTTRCASPPRTCSAVRGRRS